MKRRLGPVFKVFVPFAPILAKRLDASVASIGVYPGSTEHLPDDIDAIKDVRLRDNCRFNSHSSERVTSRFPAGKFPMHDIVREVVLSVFVSTGKAPFIQHLNVVVETDARRFVVVDKPALPANALNEPNCGAVADAQVPGRVDPDVFVDLQLADAALRQHDPHLVGVECSLNSRLPLTLELLRILVWSTFVLTSQGRHLISIEQTALRGSQHHVKPIRTFLRLGVEPMKGVLALRRADKGRPALAIRKHRPNDLTP
jgi:hypothetical protein